MPRKDESDYIVKVVVENDNQVANGTSQIKAIATVTQSDGKTLVPDATVNWSFLDGVIAIFTDSKKSTTTGKTDSNGQSTVTFTDTKSETGRVAATAPMPNHDNPEGDASFNFWNAIPEKISLALTPAGGVYADSGQYITAVAKATDNGRPYNLPGQSIHFQLVTGNKDNTQFFDKYGSKGQQVTVPITTGDKDPAGHGTATAYFKGPMWETGKCEAWWTVDNADKPWDSKPYSINTPPMMVDLQPLTTYADDGKNTVCECDHAPAAKYVSASQPGGFTFTARVFDKLTNEPLQIWKNGGNALFTLPNPGPTAVIPTGSGITQDPNNPAQYWVPISKTNGRASLSFWDTTWNGTDITGSVSVYVPDLNADKASNTVSATYTLGDPWHGVSSALIQYDGTYQSATIYDNGNNQAKVLVTLILTDRNGELLADDQMPAPATVYGAVKLLNYQTGEELGTGGSTIWKYSQTANEYQNEIPGTASDRLARGVATHPSHTPPSIGRADSGNGQIVLTYYVTCNNSGRGGSVSFGVQVTPTGGHVDLTGQIDQRTLVKTGTYATGFPAIKYWSGDPKHQFNPLTSLTAKTPPAYTLNMLDIQGSHTPHSNEDDDGQSIDSTTGFDSKDNFWRQWDYRITISNDPQKNTYGTKLFKCTLASVFDFNQLTSNNYCFGEQSNSGFYDYKAYLWPTNITQVDGKTAITTNTSATMSAPAAESQTYTFPSAAGPGDVVYMYVTLYMAYAGRAISQNNNYPVSVFIYDNFGTKALYKFDYSSLPQAYETAAATNDSTKPHPLSDWKPLTYVSGGFVERTVALPQKDIPMPAAQDKALRPHPRNKGVISLGLIDLKNVQASQGDNPTNDTIITNPSVVPVGGWHIVILDSVSSKATWIQYADADSGNNTYASTTNLFLSNVVDTNYWLTQDPDFPDPPSEAMQQPKTMDRNIVLATGARDQDSNSFCRFTPIWSQQNTAIVFENTKQYMYYPGNSTSPGYGLDSRPYVYVGAFAKGDAKYQWQIIIAPS
jgi:hypothetical protein